MYIKCKIIFMNFNPISNKLENSSISKKMYEKVPHLSHVSGPLVWLLSHVVVVHGVLIWVNVDRLW